MVRPLLDGEQDGHDTKTRPRATANRRLLFMATMQCIIPTNNMRNQASDRQPYWYISRSLSMPFTLMPQCHAMLSAIPSYRIPPHPIPCPRSHRTLDPHNTNRHLCSIAVLLALNASLSLLVSLTFCGNSLTATPNTAIAAAP